MAKLSENDTKASSESSENWDVQKNIPVIAQGSVFGISIWCVL